MECAYLNDEDKKKDKYTKIPRFNLENRYIFLHLSFEINNSYSRKN